MKKAKVEVQDANPEEPVVTQENVVGEIPVAESTAPNATETALAELTNDLQRTRAASKWKCKNLRPWPPPSMPLLPSFCHW